MIDKTKLKHWQSWPEWVVEIRLHYRHCIYKSHFHKTMFFYENAPNRDDASLWIENHVNNLDGILAAGVVKVYTKEKFESLIKSNPDVLKKREHPQKQEILNKLKISI